MEEERRVKTKDSLKTVLFVCVHNSGRSQMAEAFFDHLAGGRARAISAGTNPDAALDPVVVKVMKELGIDLSGKKPKMLTPEMMGQADEVVSMGCGVEGVCPARYIKTEDWGIADPKGRPVEEVRRIRDEIRTRVEQMLEELSSSGEQG